MGPTTGKLHLKAFGKSVAFGTLAGAAAPLTLTVIMALSSFKDVFAGQFTIWQTLYLATLPLIITFPIVLSTSIAFGLPTTLLLKATNSESAKAYGAIGAIAGFLIPLGGLFLMEAEAGYWVAMLGAVAGAVSGYTWWNNARAPHDNPGHDPLSRGVED